MEWISFYCCLPLEELDYLEKTLKEYKIGDYLITHEVSQSSHKLTDGSHFHFVVQMSTKDYDAYVKKIFKTKYKLKGQARNGIGKQYGRVKDLRNAELMKSYALKDNGEFRTSLSDVLLEELRSKSYKKVDRVKEDKDMKKDLMEYLLEQEQILHNKYYDKDPYGKYVIDPTQIRIKLISFFRNHPTYRPNLNRSMIDRYINYFLLYYHNDITDEDVFYQIY